MRVVIGMAAIKKAVGLLYQQCSAEICQQIKLELTNRCSDIEIRADVAVDSKDPIEINDEDREKLQSVEILLVEVPVFLRCSFQFTNLKWLQCLSAGVDALTRNVTVSHLPEYVVTRDGVSFPDHVAQYVLGVILARERHLIEHHHSHQVKLWHPLHHGDLSTLSLGILGVGVIGKRIAEIVKICLNMTVWGFVRTLPTPKSRCSSVDEYRTIEQLPELLSKCDYVCSVLPSIWETDGFLDGEVLSHCQHKKSILINVGRGNVIKNSTITRALNEGWLSHAILDVFEKEPLPVDSELWTDPRVTITPHIAGYDINCPKFVDEFCANFQRYKSNQPMTYVVDWMKGY